MSRDLSSELDHVRGALDAKAEREAEQRDLDQQPAATPRRPCDHGHPARFPIPPPQPRSDHLRSVLYDRDRSYRVRASEIRTLTDLGRFRVVGAEDLLRYAYSGDRQAMQADLRNLVRQELIRNGTFDGSEATPRELLTLSKAGFRMLCANRLVAKEQAIYCGFLNPRETNHDADLYVLYQKEAARIQGQGGRPVCVVLDFELKKRINLAFAKFGTEARKEIAECHALRVVRGKIPVPDMRIEYERPDGEMARVDLELVTEHYRGRSIAAKVLAGFSLYTPRGEGDRLRRVLGQHELTAEIHSL
jgi:hypothetical protein